MGLIKTLAPGWAVRRAEARLKLRQVETAERLVQSYDAARTGGRMSGWRRPHSSANTENQGALPFLRASARELVRNSPHGSRAVRVLASHIAGTGVRPRAIVNSPDRDAREAIQRDTSEEWERFVENCDPAGMQDFYGQQRLLTRTVVESGEGLRHWFPLIEDGRLRWRCHIIESDYLDHLKNEVRADGSRIVQGVEFDKLGRRVAYHLHKEHPGERYLPGGFGFDLKRIDAQYVDHIFEVLRPGQVRGVSWFAPSATTVRDVTDLAEAELVRKKLEACISMVVHNANDEVDEGGAITAAVSDGNFLQDTEGNVVEAMTPGMVLEARPGWSVDMNAPAPSQGLAEHMRERLQAIAAGIGTTYSQMTGDLTGANYSSMRAGDLEFSRLVTTWQNDLMKFQSGGRAWRRVMTASQMSGELGLPVIPRAKWTPPKRPWVDPKNETTASHMQMEDGTLSPMELIEERSGRAAEEVLDEMAEWQAALEARGLTTAITYAAAATPAPKDDSEKDDDDDDTSDDEKSKGDAAGDDDTSGDE